MEKGKERLFEVMGRLDKTFKPKLNEEIGDMGDGGMPDTGQAPDFQDMAAPEAMPDEEVPAEEKSPEEKLADLTAKVDEMYAMLHGEEEAPAEEPEEIEVTTGEVDVDPENLQEWNFDKKKGEKEDDKEEKKDDDKEEKKDGETEVEVKVEVEESEEKKEKIPVAAVAKVGK